VQLSEYIFISRCLFKGKYDLDSITKLSSSTGKGPHSRTRKYLARQKLRETLATGSGQGTLSEIREKSPRALQHEPLQQHQQQQQQLQMLAPSHPREAETLMQQDEPVAEDETEPQPSDEKKEVAIQVI
jgi:hypothetical protein